MEHGACWKFTEQAQLQEKNSRNSAWQRGKMGKEHVPLGKSHTNPDFHGFPVSQKSRNKRLVLFGMATYQLVHADSSRRNL
jgi:hypothetical protein